MNFWIEQLSLWVIATFANLLSAMAGGGAGLIQLPLLIFLGLPFAMAVATHKIATVALGVGASIRHAQSNTLELKFCLWILATGLPGVVAGANCVLSLPEAPARYCLGGLTVGLGAYSILKKQLGQHHVPHHRDTKGMIIGGGVLFLLGVLNGSLTSGTGLFVTLWLVRWFGLDYTRATAYTLVLVGLFWNGTGAVTLTLLTAPQWDWLPALILGSIMGGYWGAHLAITKGNPIIKKLFEWVTILVGVSLIATTLYTSLGVSEKVFTDFNATKAHNEPHNQNMTPDRRLYSRAD